MCRLSGHYARDCIITKDFCFECGIKGHIARDCQENVRNAKILTENRVKAIFSQKIPYRLLNPNEKMNNLVNYYKSLNI